MLAPTCNSVAEVSIFRIMKGLMTPPVHFNCSSTMCSTIPEYNFVFSFVLDDSYVPAEDPAHVPRDLLEDTKGVQSLVSKILPPFPRYFISPPKVGRVTPGQSW